MTERVSSPSEPDRRPWLIAEDWQSRALLLAELQERGIEMRAEAGIKWALYITLHEHIAPPLILLVTHRDSLATPGRVARLLRLLEADDVQPILLLLVSAFEKELWQPFDGRATILTRPKTVGEIAQVVERYLKTRSLK